MKYADVRLLLENQIDSDKSEQAYSEFSGLVKTLMATEHWDFLCAVSDHLITQTLRAGGGGLEGYGRVQGINALIDFLKLMSISPQKRASTEPVQPATQRPENLQGSYATV